MMHNASSSNPPAPWNIQPNPVAMVGPPRQNTAMLMTPSNTGSLPQNTRGPPQGMGGPPQNMGGPLQNMGDPQQNIIGPQQNMNGPQQNIISQHQNIGGPQQTMSGPQQNRGGPQQNMSDVQRFGGPSQQNGMSGVPMISAKGPPIQSHGVEEGEVFDIPQAKKPAYLANSPMSGRNGQPAGYADNFGQGQPLATRDPRKNLIHANMSPLELSAAVARAIPQPNTGLPPLHFWLVGNCINRLKADTLDNIISIAGAPLDTLIGAVKSQLQMAASDPTFRPPHLIFCVGPVDLIPDNDMDNVKERIYHLTVRLCGIREEFGDSISNISICTIHPPYMRARNHPNPDVAQQLANMVFRLYNSFVFLLNNGNNIKPPRLDKAFHCDKDIYRLRSNQLELDGVQPNAENAETLNGRIARHIACIKSEWYEPPRSPTDNHGFGRNWERLDRALTTYLEQMTLLKNGQVPSILPRPTMPPAHLRKRSADADNQGRPGLPPPNKTSVGITPLMSTDIRRPVSPAQSRDLMVPSLSPGDPEVPLAVGVPGGEPLPPLVPRERSDLRPVNRNIECARMLVRRMPEHLSPWIDGIYTSFIEKEERIARIRAEEDRIRMEDFDAELEHLCPGY